MRTLRVTVSFEGGLELLFGKVKSYELVLPLQASSSAAGSDGGPRDALSASAPLSDAHAAVLAAAAGVGSAVPAHGQSHGCGKGDGGPSGACACSSATVAGAGSSTDATAASPTCTSGATAAVTAATPISSPPTLGALILWLRDNLLTERPELFVVGASLCVRLCPRWCWCCCTTFTGGG